MNAPSATATDALASMPSGARMLMRALARLRSGQLSLTCPDGQSLSFAGERSGPHADIELADWGVCDEVIRAGDIGFAEAYLRGRWRTGDLTALIALVAINREALLAPVHGTWWGTLLFRLAHLMRANTRRGSQRNIHAHYDLGNDFYARWLDPSMTYSSALFEGDFSRSLEAAQYAKYERILRRLDVQPGDALLEIGCGWGAFAEYAARTRGCTVRGITVSRRQLDYARRRIDNAGLAQRVSIDYCDYRDVTGSYRHVVSIEMYEAVGARFWPVYFRTVGQRLAPGGKAMLQAIVIDDRLYDTYRAGTDFIKQYIFPGGMLASPSVFAAQAGRAGLKVGDRMAFGADYAETLRRWAESFNLAWPSIEGGKFDARFHRLWNFYLSYCEAGFRAGSTDVHQVELTHAR